MQDSSLVGRKAKKDDNVFFTPLDPWADEIEEKFEDHLSKPGKLNYNSIRRFLDSFGQGTRKRPNVSQEDLTPSSFMILCLLIASKILISETVEKTLYQRRSTLRPAPRTILKNACNQQQGNRSRRDTKVVATVGDCGGGTGNHVAKRTGFVSSRSQDSRSVA